MISLETAAAEGVLFLAPEPRSPHATVYGFDLPKKAMDAKNFEGRDRYGVPILKFDAGWWPGFKVIDKIPVHYNIGHLATAQGNTMDPQGKDLIAMNKWSIDRHAKVGPLHPQNFQLIDISGPKMELIADMPIGFGEPHHAQLVKAETIKAHEVYGFGVSPATMQHSADSVVGSQEARIKTPPWRRRGVDDPLGVTPG